MDGERSRPLDLFNFAFSTHILCFDCRYTLRQHSQHPRNRSPRDQQQDTAATMGPLTAIIYVGT